MTREEIIQGLQFTIDMFLSDPSTGEVFEEPRNDMDKITIDACKGAIKELQDNSYELWKESYEVEHERNIRLEENIKALEQAECEDAISRADAIKTAIEAADDWDGGYNLTRADIIEKAIKSLPPVTPQPKMGRWIYEKRKRLINETDEGAEYVTDYWCKCSNCGGDFGYRKMKDAFCKYCGAKMIEPQESEEV